MNLHRDDDAPGGRSLEREAFPSEPTLANGRKALRERAGLARRRSRRLRSERVARIADQPEPVDRDLEVGHEVLLAAQRERGQARAAVVRAFTPMIVEMAQRYRDSELDFDELIQAGAVGLLRALARYDPSEDLPFWAYASWWVRQGMQQSVADVARVARWDGAG